MSDPIEDLVKIYIGAVPPDVIATDIGMDIAYTLAEMFALAYSEIQRLAAGAVISTATGLFLELHARDHKLRKQSGETETQLRERLKKPPQAATLSAILEALEAIVGVQATLDLNPLTANCETVVRAKRRGAPGNLVSLQFINDGTTTGQLIEEDNRAVFHYASGVTTVANFESAVASSELLEVQTVDGVGTLTHPGDTFGQTNLSGGYNRAIVVELPLKSAYFDRSHCFDRGKRMGGGRGVVVAMIPSSLAAKNSISDALRAKASAGKIKLVEEYT